jgi:hypothetical protein
MAALFHIGRPDDTRPARDGELRASAFTAVARGLE